MTTKPSTPPEMLARTLLDAYDRYAKGNPFKPGDLVTPRAHYNIRGAGGPHVVLDVFDIDLSRAPDRKPTDMRIVCEEEGEIVSFLGESYEYEPWTGEVWKP